MKKFISDAIYIVTVIALITYIAMNLFMPKNVTSLFGIQTLVIMTDSMDPVIAIDDLIVIKQPDYDELEVGDIITFETYIANFDEEVLVTHYIAEIYEEDGVRYYRTNSVKNQLEDVWRDEIGEIDNITDDDIIGEFLFKVPNAATGIKFIKSPIFAALALFNIVIIVVISKFLKK